MTRLRHKLLSVRDLLVAAGPVGLLGIALIALAYWWLDPAPPKHLVLATGPKQSAYAEFGLRYAQALALHGVKVELRATQGSAENLALLQAGDVDAAFVQGGTAPQRAPDEDDTSGLASLGSLFREPVWVFYRTA
ncbi:MAG: hypothetical protein RL375_2216, partial [Pseudomonadota bacterium]